MPVIGKIELKADKDVEKDTEISLLELFPYEERVKPLTLEADVTRDQTRLKINIAKVGTIDSVADATKKTGEQVHLWALMKYAQSSKKVKLQEAIKKDEALAVTVETP
jgi:hypothetical protein